MSFEALQKVARATHHPNGRTIARIERSVLTVLADLDPQRSSPQTIALRCALSSSEILDVLAVLKVAGTITDSADAAGYSFRFMPPKGSLPALEQLVKVARSWHEFHAHEPQLIQCDAICDALPASEAELKAVQA